MRTVRYDFDFVRAQGRRLGRDLCARLAGLCLVSGPMAPDPTLLDDRPRTPPYGENGHTPHRDRPVRDRPSRDWPHSDWEAR
ncbi:hypothetical protein QF026_007611 [Streptomyces aurantiacus]|uniref:hypothetical protein n=1 Tax=Streptomyces aurantiacus TaxID=47760 RepID=UPI00278FFF2B|nr:hypothetical protein [Streptomyces aurantiacus]MDQ0779145.1 hypothetical protein [Streptomyces aurantiacus]